MNKIAFLLGLIFMLASCQAQEPDFSLLHYNIKELDSSKLHADHPQILALKHVLMPYSFDILSVNEVQFDLPAVPNSVYKTKGENLTKLRELLELPELKYQVFFQANTGNNAATKSDGTYHTDPNSSQARALADQVNFGIFPGQYSTGALFKFKKESVKVYTDIAWKLFNPQLDLNQYQDAEGNTFPSDMSLFDKNFTDVVLNIKGKKVHLILFHTVPAFNFGNARGLNIERNRDQLRFLEWYLTGKTDIPVNIPGVKPLEKDAYFVAVGDWNVAPDNADAAGSEVINRLFAKLNTWLKKEQLTFTNESSHFAPKPFRLMLDYIISSKNIEIVEGSIIHPEFIREELGCHKGHRDVHPTDNMVAVEYQDNGMHCSALLGVDYFNFKMASDHYPLYAKFKFK